MAPGSIAAAVAPTAGAQDLQHLAVGISKADVDFISAHATSTVLTDRTEARAIRSLFGPRADDIAVTGLKSMTGHATAASGAIEAPAAALLIREGMLTPTINYETPDPECVLDYVPNKARQMNVRACMNKLGFGGPNASLIVKKH